MSWLRLKRFISWISRRIHFHRFADVAPAGEIPFIGKSGTLNGFHGLNAAVPSFEKNAGFVRVIYQGETVAAGTEPRVALNEISFT
jgi:hypothetical protein